MNEGKLLEEKYLVLLFLLYGHKKVKNKPCRNERRGREELMTNQVKSGLGTGRNAYAVPVSAQVTGISSFTSSSCSDTTLVFVSFSVCAAAWLRAK